MTEHGRSGRNVTLRQSFSCCCCLVRHHEPRWRHWKFEKTQILIKPAVMLSQQIAHRKYPNAVIPRLYFHIKLMASMFLRLCSGQPRMYKNKCCPCRCDKHLSGALSHYSPYTAVGPGEEKTTYSTFYTRAKALLTLSPPI